jgi:O-antigen/teichoic acid export membrane protein
MLKRLGKEVIIYGIASSLSKFIGIFLIPIYTAYFSKEEYGSLDLISTIISFAAIFGMLQLESAISRYYFEVEEKRRKVYISTAFWNILLFSSIIVLITFLFSDLITFLLFNNYNYSYIIKIASINILLFNIFGFLTVLIRYQKKPLFYSLVVFIQFMLTGAISVILIYFFHFKIVSFFIGQIVGLFFGSIIMLIYLKDYLKFAYDINVLKMFFKYSIPQLPAVCGGWLNTYLNRFIMLGYLSISQIGIFTVSLQIASIFRLLENAFRMTWEPFIWEQLKKKDYKIKLYNLSKLITLIILSFAVLLSLFAEELQSILSSKDYIETVGIIKLLFLALSFPIISQVIGIGISIAEKTKYLSICYFIGVGINILFLFILAPNIGLIGVPISLIISNISIFIFMWYYSEKLHPINYDKYTISLYCIFAILFTVGIYIYPPSFLLKSVFVLVLLIVLYIFKNTIKYKLKKI